MPVFRHAFQMFNFTKKLSVTDDLPEGGGLVSINITLQNPPDVIQFKGKEIVMILSTVNIRMEKVAEVIMRGESLYAFKDDDEKKLCLSSLEENKRLPHDVEKHIMNIIATRAVLSVVKAHAELGIPPPISLPILEPE